MAFLLSMSPDRDDFALGRCLDCDRGSAGYGPIMRPIIRETIVERRQPQMRWSAVFAGAVVSVGLWVLLQMLGTGIGLAVIDTNDPHSLRGIGIGTGIWSVIAPLLALFFGGMVAG